MKSLTLRKNTYYWNEFWDFIFLPISPSRKREIIFKSGSRMYNRLSSQNGWRKET